MSLGKRLYFCALLTALCALGCRQKMSYQPRYDPLEPSDFFADHMAARPRIAGTVSRDELVTNTYMQTGKINGADGDGFPIPVTQQVLDRGEERFNIYCSPCHGRTGLGDGMVVRRGYRRPPSLHDDRLRNAAVGHFFDVMTNGFGAMPDYAAQVRPEDRWAIAAYVRALQLSEHATMEDVPAANRSALDQSTTVPTEKRQ